MPVTELMAMMSPKCSMTGARVTGMMKSSGSQENSGRLNAGRASQGLLPTASQLVTPMISAITSPAAIPHRMGTRRSMPRPSRETATVTARETMEMLMAVAWGMAGPLWPRAILTAVGASTRPMTMMTGPVTMGGSRRRMSPMPRQRMSRLMNT